MSGRFSPLFSRFPAAFQMIMSAQPSDGERFETAYKMAQRSGDPAMREAAALVAQWFVIAHCDPDADITTITTSEAGRAHIERMRHDPAVAARFNEYFVGI